MRTHDSLGRQLPNHGISTGKRISELRGARAKLIECIHWFGRLSSAHAHAVLRTHGMINEKNRRVALTDLSREDKTPHGSRYLYRPQEQFPNPKKALFNRHLRLVLDIAPAGVRWLKETGRYVDGLLHGGHFDHQLMESCVLSEIYLGAENTQGYTFRPHHQLLRDTPNEYKVPIVYKGKTIDTELRPDAHFAINYGETQRHYFLEVDRGSEQRGGVLLGKKTIERSLRQYRAFIGRLDGVHPLYHKALKTEDAAVVLFLFSKKSKMESAMKLLDEITEGKGNNYIGFRYDERFADPDFTPPEVSLLNWTEPWECLKRPPISISTP